MQLLSKTDPSSTPYVQAVVANRAGEIYELDEYAAVGMSAGVLVPLLAVDTIDMPHGSELMRLPQRRPVVFNLQKQQAETLKEDPYAPGNPIFPVAAFNSPGYMISHVCAYDEKPGADPLPMFSYGAVGWYGDEFRSAAVLVDEEPRQDLRRMPLKRVLAGIKRMRNEIPQNRLRRHLEKCAQDYGCPAAKNFFLGRYEAPLPTSQSCNARCRGCLSLQENTGIAASQERIWFTPAPEEIAEVALTHIAQVAQPVVSFGQGCEGDPLLAAHAIEPAIGLIREQTIDGTIHMNTNASRPHTLDRLFNAGLDSIRVSLNSVRPDVYHAYFRPHRYCFDDVLKSIDLALSRGRFVAINYLNSPGITDSLEELDALTRFIRTHPIHMIQWRNLNFDPRRYWEALPLTEESIQPVGMKCLLNTIKDRYPDVMHGYFNPPREKWPRSVRNAAA